MKAAYIEQPGGAENILYADFPMPEPREGEVLVRVKRDEAWELGR